MGGIYALVATGYTMVYGVLKLINFAHGDLFTIGAYLGLTLLVSCNLAGDAAYGWPCWRSSSWWASWWPSSAAYLLERAYRLRKAGRLSA